MCPAGPSPDSTPTFFCWSALLKLYQLQYARAFTLRPFRSTSSDPPLMVSYTWVQGGRGGEVQTDHDVHHK
jgi:hypothetical protein